MIWQSTTSTYISGEPRYTGVECIIPWHLPELLKIQGKSVFNWFGRCSIVFHTMTVNWLESSKDLGLCWWDHGITVHGLSWNTPWHCWDWHRWPNYIVGWPGQRVQPNWIRCSNKGVHQTNHQNKIHWTIGKIVENLRNRGGGWCLFLQQGLFDL